ncbi:Lipopolysaccharide-assembly [Desulfomicrobium norvegicum]|uniref:Lipopolysaccharide-assembly n=1 Tax=Desulfomicrobium norvegicum (strain DSM 1741 / NCIMB 8310) TaxID=52561 RepID=A0A8G2C0I8_DESNO|nr:LPS assembly lipoprotein LptE [Desulfomicrobium norvegicum]SFL34628.1 Lipopolysaccharide-assembly [Desulfomicrobium norvegicum]
MWAVLCIALLLPACGYQLTARAPIQLPQDSTRLYLDKVTNPTTETWIEPMLRSSLRDELTRRGNVTWVSRDEAEATVNIDVRSYSTSDALKGRDDVTLKSAASIQMVVTFFSTKTNALIWTSGPILASESFRGASEIQSSSGTLQSTSAKREATQEAVDLAVRKVADQLGQKF